MVTSTPLRHGLTHRRRHKFWLCSCLCRRTRLRRRPWSNAVAHCHNTDTDLHRDLRRKAFERINTRDVMLWRWRNRRKQKLNGKRRSVSVRMAQQQLDIHSRVFRRLKKTPYDANEQWRTHSWRHLSFAFSSPCQILTQDMVEVSVKNTAARDWTLHRFDFWSYTQRKGASGKGQESRASEGGQRGDFTPLLGFWYLIFFFSVQKRFSLFRVCKMTIHRCLPPHPRKCILPTPMVKELKSCRYKETN